MNGVVPHRRHSITFRMTMAVCVFVILIQSLMAFLSMSYFKQELKQTISSQQMTLMTVVAGGIDQKLRDAQKTIVTSSSEFTPEIVADAIQAQHLLGHLRGIETIFDHGLYLFSKEGRIIADSSNNPNLRGMDISFREHFQRTVATGRPVISVPFHSGTTTGVPVVAFTAPVLDKNGALIAVLSGGVNLLKDNFLGELSHTRIGTTGYLYLVTPDGSLILHPDKSRTLTDKVPPGANKLLDRAAVGFEGAEENTTSKGLEALTSFKHLKMTDWILGGNYPLEEAYEPIYRAQKYCIAAVIISAFLTILVIRWMMESYTDALVRFARHVKDIAFKKGPERLFLPETRDEIGILAGCFNTMIQEYDDRSEELHHISNHDALSGLYNRAYFDEELKRLSSSRITPISVVMIDIDDLKVCNDKYGHSVGDALIKATSQVLLDSFRIEDAVARVGGDEFAVLLPGVDAEHAQIAMDRVRSFASRYENLEMGIPMSISLGHATVENPSDLPEAIKQADQEMYLDKISRKAQKESEQICLFDNEIPIPTQGGSTNEWQR
jgi:diguanylate cyclase (GGDEF)-like protein